VSQELMESDVAMYAMGIFDPEYAVNHTSEEKRGPQLLEDLAARSGGTHVPVGDLDELPAIGARIGLELRNQYLLGYYPTNAARDGKYRRVTVKLDLPATAQPVHASYRRGYYAPNR